MMSRSSSLARLAAAVSAHRGSRGLLACVVSAAKASTYAYVNPIIAVILGWLFANEPLSARTLVAAAVILGGVAIITSSQGAKTATSGESPLPTPSKDTQRTAA